MAFTEDISLFFVDFGEAVTVQGVAAVGIFNTSSEVVLGEALVMAPTLELPATVAAAEGGSVVVRSLTYKIRQVLDVPPDGALRQLVLARV